MEIQASPVFYKHITALQNPDTKIIVHQGGTRSSKTYSILLDIALDLVTNRYGIITVARKTQVSHEITTIRDFEEIIQSLGFTDKVRHVKDPMHMFTYKNSVVEFVGMDKAERKRGSKRDKLYLNEAEQLEWDDFFQLNVRNTGKTILDYNPSMSKNHWIVKKILPRKDCEFIQSTYRDNPFLPQSMVYEIELAREQDDNYWQVFGLGEFGVPLEVIWNNWDIVDEFPPGCKMVGGGVDFGFNHPSVMLKIGLKGDNDLYIDELVYGRGMTNKQFDDACKEAWPDYNQEQVVCDSEAPDKIVELNGWGWNTLPANKGKGSVVMSIDLVKRYRLHITKRSINTIEEIEKWSWKKDREGNILPDQPMDIRDDAMACIRYYVFNILNQNRVIINEDLLDEVGQTYGSWG